MEGICKYCKLEGKDKIEKGGGTVSFGNNIALDLEILSL
jgi:hypothetical protein